MSDSRLRRDLLCCISDGAAFGLMVGIGETYVPAFVLALGLGSVLAGLVITVPMLIGSLLQMAGPALGRRIGSLRVWVTICSLMQSLSLLPLVYVAFDPRWSGFWVYLSMTAYWAFGLAAGPSWNQWVESLIPRTMRANFFARRSRLNQACVVAGLILGGWLLRWGAGTDWQLLGYAVLFSLAAIARLVSTALLWSQSEFREPLVLSAGTLSVGGRRGEPWSKETRRLVVYLLAIQLSVYVAGPYFTPFMLVQLELSYTTYMILLCGGFLGKVLVFPLAGRLANRIGPQKMLWLGGWLIAPVSSLWLVSGSWWYLLGVQLLSGGFWAIFELAIFLMFLESIPKGQRVSILTWYNLGSSAAMFCGSMIGAVVLYFLGASHVAFATLFGVSAVGRLAAMWLFPDRELKHWEQWQRVVIRTLSIRPGAASVDRPVPAALVPEVSAEQLVHDSNCD